MTAYNREQAELGDEGAAPNDVPDDDSPDVGDEDDSPVPPNPVQVNVDVNDDQS